METSASVNLNIEIEASLLEDADALAASEAITRDELVTRALSTCIVRRRRRLEAYTIVEQRGSLAGINSDEDIDAILAAIRKRRRSGEG